MRIDAHQHYWKIARGDYGWITPELPTLYRDFLPGDLEPLLAQERLDGSLLVQAAPTIEESRFLLELAERHPSVLGVVGWLDLCHPNHRDHYDELRRYSKFAGFRLMIQDMPDVSRILEPAFVEALRSYADEDVPVDLLLTADQLDPVLELLRQVPHLRAVVDHLAKPGIRQRQFEPWASRLSELALLPNLFCKVSGVVTEGDHDGWKTEDFAPYLRHALEVFGPERVMFGSDWPVCLLAASYEQVADIPLRAIPQEWGERERALLFGGNAKIFYKL